MTSKKLDKIVFIVIADEVLRGKIIDKHTQWISRNLAKFGLEIDEVCIVKDEEEKIIEVIRRYIDQAQLIITSGGLGPTKDDVTKSAIAKGLNVELKENKKAIELTSNPIYQLVPEGFHPLENKAGKALGLAKYYDEKSSNSQKASMIIMPGVPVELQYIFSTHFSPQLFGLNQGKKEFNNPHCLIAKTSSVAESKIFNQWDLKLWEDLEKISKGSVCSYPLSYGVDIHVNYTTQDSTENEIISKNLERRFLESPIKSSIFYIGEYLTLSELVQKKFIEKKITLSIAESATAGAISHLLTLSKGASSYFLGGIICYDEKIKLEQLNVKKATIQNHGIVSTQVAKEMAIGCLEKFNSDWGLSLTGVAGPGSYTLDDGSLVEIGSVCIGLYNKKLNILKSVEKKVSNKSLEETSLAREHNIQVFVHIALISLLENL